MPITYQLRDGSRVRDPRLDRLQQFDERSRGFAIRTLVSGKKLRSYTWSCTKFLNQKNEGACVGFGITHELIAQPAPVQNLAAKFARERIYWKAQEIDEWNGGAYPNAFPFYEGTSVLAGVKVAHALGYFKEYRWQFNIDDLLLGVGYQGPAVIGVNWYEGMMNTDANGFIRPTGKMVGGHCTMIPQIKVREEYLRIHNSWGLSWGENGTAKISFEDMRRLLKEDGEAVFFIQRKSKV